MTRGLRLSNAAGTRIGDYPRTGPADHRVGSFILCNTPQTPEPQMPQDKNSRIETIKADILAKERQIAQLLLELEELLAKP